MNAEKARDNFAQSLAENAYLNMCTAEEMKITIEALEKQIPKKPKCPAPPFFECPMCKAPVGDWQNHCENCGQALDWEGYRDENQPRQ